MAQSSTNTSKLGVVTDLAKGQLLAIDDQGNTRKLDVGSEIFLNERLEVKSNAKAIIELANGKSITIPSSGYQQTLQDAISGQLNQSAAQDSDEPEVLLAADVDTEVEGEEPTEEPEEATEEPRDLTQAIAEEATLPNTRHSDPLKLKAYPDSPVDPGVPTEGPTTPYDRFIPEDLRERFLEDFRAPPTFVPCVSITRVEEGEITSDAVEGEPAVFCIGIDNIDSVPYDIKVTVSAVPMPEGGTATLGTATEPDFDAITFFLDPECTEPLDMNMVTIPAGENDVKIYVKTIDDMKVEFLETFTIEISDPVNAKITVPTAWGTITDNDCSTIDIIGGYSVIEDDQPALVKFTLKVDKPSDAAMKVTLSMCESDMGKTAIPGVDFDDTRFFDKDGNIISDNLMVTIPMCAEELDIYVKVFDDEKVEFKENFVVKIDAVENILTDLPEEQDPETIADPKIGRDEACGMIFDDDCATISLYGYGKTEEGGFIKFTVKSDKCSDADMGVFLKGFGLGKHPATPGKDFQDKKFFVYDEYSGKYVATDGPKVVIPAGEQVVDFYVKVKDDMRVEFTEKFGLKIKSVKNLSKDMTINEPKIDEYHNLVVGKIIDNDCATISIKGSNMSIEGDFVKFSLHTDKVSDVDMVVFMKARGVSKNPADKGDDFVGKTFFVYNHHTHEYDSTNGTAVVIPAGHKWVDFYVKTKDDMQVEFKENFIVKIQDVKNLTYDKHPISEPKVGKDKAIGMIKDNDCATVSIKGGGKVHEGEFIKFSVHSDKISDADMKVFLKSFGVGKHPATPGKDYVGKTVFVMDKHSHELEPVGSNNVVIPAGEQWVDFYVKTKDDNRTEFKETFAFKIWDVKNLSYNPTIAEPKIGYDKAIGVIKDNDCSTVTISGGNTTVTESNILGGGNAVKEGGLIGFTLNLDKVSDADIKVWLKTRGEGKHPADPGKDFVAKNFLVYDHEAYDYVKTDGPMVIIPAGHKSMNFYVKTKDDMKVEFKENFAVDIKYVENVTDSPSLIADPKIGYEDSAIGMIKDNDCATVTIVGGGKVEEGEFIHFTLYTDKISDAPMVAYLQTKGAGKHPATPGKDYVDSNLWVFDHDLYTYVLTKGSTVVIPAGKQYTDFYIKTIDDMNVEFKENFVVRIKDVYNHVEHKGKIADPKIGYKDKAIGMIKDNDCSTVTIKGGDTVKEGGFLEFTLHTDKISDADMKVTLDSRGVGKHPASKGEDYVAKKFFEYDHYSYEYIPTDGRMVTIPAGEQWVKFYVKTKDDMNVEFKENLAVRIKKVENITEHRGEIADPKIGYKDTAIGMIRDNDCSTISISGGGKVEEGELIKFSLHTDKVSDSDMKVFLKAKGIGKHGATPGEDFVDHKFLVYNHETCEYELTKGSMVVIPAGKQWVDFYVKTIDDHYSEPTENFAIKIVDVKNLTEYKGMMDPKIDEYYDVAHGAIKDNDCVTIDIKGGNKVYEGEYVEFTLDVDRYVDADIKATLHLEGAGDYAANEYDFEGGYYIKDEYGSYQPVYGNMITIPEGKGWMKFYVKTHDDYNYEHEEGFKIYLKDVQFVEDYDIDYDREWGDGYYEKWLPELKVGKEWAMGWIQDNDHDDCITVSINGGGEVHEGGYIAFNLEMDKYSEYDINCYLKMEGKGEHQANWSDFEGKFYVHDHETDSYVHAGNDYITIPSYATSKTIYMKTHDDYEHEYEEGFKVTLYDVQYGEGDQVPSLNEGEHHHYELKIGNEWAAGWIYDNDGNGHDDCITMDIKGGGEVYEGGYIPFTIEMDKYSECDIHCYMRMEGYGEHQANWSEDFDGKFYVHDHETDGYKEVHYDYITMPAHATSQTFYVKTHDDYEHEYDEGFKMVMNDVKYDEGYEHEYGAPKHELKVGNEWAEGWIKDNDYEHNDDCIYVDVKGGDSVYEGGYVPFWVQVSEYADHDVKCHVKMQGKGEHGANWSDFEGKFYVHDHETDGYKELEHDYITIAEGHKWETFYMKTHDDYEHEHDEGFKVVLHEVEYGYDEGYDYEPSKDHELKVGHEWAEGWIKDNDHGKVTVDLKGGDKVSEGEYVPFTLWVDKPFECDIKATLKVKGVGDHPANEHDFEGIYIKDHYDQYQKIEGNMMVIPKEYSDVEFYVKTKDDYQVEAKEHFKVLLEKVEFVEGEYHYARKPELKVGEEKAFGWIIDNDCATVDLKGDYKAVEGEYLPFKLWVDKPIEFGIKATLEFKGAGDHPADRSDIEGIYVKDHYGQYQHVNLDDYGQFMLTVDAKAADLEFFVKTKDDYKVEPKEHFKLVLKDVQYVNEYGRPIDKVYDFQDPKIGEEKAFGWIKDNDCATVDIKGGDRVTEGEYVPFKLWVDKPIDHSIKATIEIMGAGDHAAERADFEGIFVKDHYGQYQQVIGGMLTIDANANDLEFFVKTKDDYAVEPKEHFKVVLKDVQYVDHYGRPVSEEYGFLPPKIGDGKAFGWIKDNDCATVDLKGGQKVVEGEYVPFKLWVDKPIDHGIKANLTLKGVGDHPADQHDFEGIYIKDHYGQYQQVNVDYSGNFMLTVDANAADLQFFVKTKDDYEIEPKEHFKVVLNSVQYVDHYGEPVSEEYGFLPPKVGYDKALGWIKDNDCATVDIHALSDAPVYEGDYVGFKLWVDKPTDHDIKATLKFMGVGDHPADRTDVEGIYLKVVRDGWDGDTLTEDAYYYQKVDGNMVTIPKNTDALKFFIKTTDDYMVEAKEHFKVVLQEVQYLDDYGRPLGDEYGYMQPKVGEEKALGWIKDNDCATVDLKGGAKVTEGEYVPFKLWVDKPIDHGIKANLTLKGVGDHPADQHDFEGIYIKDHYGQYQQVNVDYSGNFMLSVDANAADLKFFVKTKDDYDVEPKEHFKVVLNSVQYVDHYGEPISEQYGFMPPKVGYDKALGWIVDNDCATVDIKGGHKVVEGEYVPFKLWVDKPNDHNIKATLKFMGAGDHPADRTDVEGIYLKVVRDGWEGDSLTEDAYHYVPVEGNMVTIPKHTADLKFFVKTKDDYKVEAKEHFKIVLEDVQYVDDNGRSIDREYDFQGPKIGEEKAFGWIKDNDCATVDIDALSREPVYEGDYVGFKLKVDKPIDHDIKATLQFMGVGDHPADRADVEGIYLKVVREGWEGDMESEEAYYYQKVDGNMVTIPKNTDALKFFIKTTDDYMVEAKEHFKVVLKDVQYVDHYGQPISEEYGFMPPKVGEEKAFGWIKDNDCATVDLKGGAKVEEGQYVPFKLWVDIPINHEIKANLKLAGVGDHPADLHDIEGIYIKDHYGQYQHVDFNYGQFMLTVPSDAADLQFFVKAKDDYKIEPKEHFKVVLEDVQYVDHYGQPVSEEYGFLPPKVGEKKAFGWIKDNDCATVDVHALSDAPVYEGDYVGFKLWVDKPIDFDIKATLKFMGVGDHPADRADIEGIYLKVLRAGWEGDMESEEAYYYQKVEGNMVTIPKNTDALKFFIKTTDDYMVEPKEHFKIVLEDVQYVDHYGQPISEEYGYLPPKVGEGKAFAWVHDNDCATVDLKGGKIVVEGEYVPFKLWVDKPIDHDIKANLTLRGVGDHPADLHDFEGIYIKDHYGQYQQVDLDYSGNFMLNVGANAADLQFFVKTKDDYKIETKEHFKVVLNSVQYVDHYGQPVNEEYGFLPPKVGDNKALAWIEDNDCATVDIKGGQKVTEGQYVPFKLWVDKPNEFNIKANLVFKGKGDHPADLKDIKGIFIKDHYGEYQSVDFRYGNFMLTIPKEYADIEFYVKTKDDYYVEAKEHFKIVLKDVQYVDDYGQPVDQSYSIEGPKVGKEWAAAWIQDNDCATVDIKGDGEVYEGDYVGFRLEVDKHSEFDIKATLDLEGKGYNPADEYDFHGKFWVHDHETDGYKEVTGDMLIIPSDQKWVTFYVKTKDDYKHEEMEGFKVILKDVKYVDHYGQPVSEEYGVLEPKVGKDHADSWIKDNDCDSHGEHHDKDGGVSYGDVFDGKDGDSHDLKDVYNHYSKDGDRDGDRHRDGHRDSDCKDDDSSNCDGDTDGSWKWSGDKDGSYPSYPAINDTSHTHTHDDYNHHG